MVLSMLHNGTVSTDGLIACLTKQLQQLSIMFLTTTEFFAATDPIFLAPSIDTMPCELVPRPLRWAWVQNSKRKWQHVLHLFIGGSPLSRLSHSNSLLPESPWRATIDNRLFRKKLTGRESTSPSGICATKKEILFGKFKSIHFSSHYFVQSQSQMVACLMVSRLICDDQITHSLTNKTNLHN